MALVDDPPGHRVGQKMLLVDQSKLDAPEAVEVFAPGDADEVVAFLDAAYPKNWFDPWMLDSGMYLGIRSDGDLVAAGGVHVYSRRYRVAAIGNVAVAAERRGEGLGRRLMSALCHRLLADVDVVALNVMRDNAPAIRLYESLGFEFVAAYHEGWVR